MPGGARSGRLAAGLAGGRGRARRRRPRLGRLAPVPAAVVEHLLRHRGLPADPGRVLATAGSTAGVAELARTLPPGARVAVEEPGYQRAVGALRDAGLTVLAAPVDEA